MNKQEAKISNKVAKWFLKETPISAPEETKHTRGKKSFNINEISEHQLHALEACTTEHGFMWKIPDANIGYLPFDYIFYKNAPACVIIVYPNAVYAIHVLDILKIKKITPLLSEKKAIELSSFTVLLKDL